MSLDVSDTGYFIDFYDAFDGWGGTMDENVEMTLAIWPDRCFRSNEFEKAKEKAEELMDDLDENNKSCGEYYAVIDYKNRKIIRV